MKVTLWHMLPLAIALHSLVLLIPTPSGNIASEQLKPKGRSVSVTQLPQPAVAKVLPQPLPTPRVKPTAPKPQASPSVPLPNPPEAAPQPVQSPTPSSAPSLAPSPSPSPSPADSLQIEGAQPGCNGLIGCWQVAETKGRIVSEAVEKKLVQQGFILTKQDLDDDTGMLVYEVKKQDGTFQYYLHVIWSDRGTVYVKQPKLISRIDELKVIAGL